MSPLEYTYVASVDGEKELDRDHGGARVDILFV